MYSIINHILLSILNYFQDTLIRFSHASGNLFDKWNFILLHVRKLARKYEYTQKQPPEVFCKKGVLRNFAKFTGKHLCQSLFFNKVSGLEVLTYPYICYK